MSEKNDINVCIGKRLNKSHNNQISEIKFRNKFLEIKNNQFNRNNILKFKYYLDDKSTKTKIFGNKFVTLNKQKLF